MTGTRISDMTAKTGLLAADLVPVVSGGANYKMAASSLFTVTPQMFGAVADDSTDCLAAFNAAIAFLTAMKIGGGFYYGTPRLYIRSGNYYLSDTLELKGITLIIEGDGVGQEGGQPTTLRWPASKCGIRLQRYNTITNTVETPATTGADGTILRNLNLQGGGGTANADFSGVWARTRLKMEDCRVRGFAGHGVLIRATQGGGGSQEGNANCWRLDSCRLVSNGKSGYALVGADANAGLATGCDTSNNAEYGIDDGSFLGNAHLGLHSEANTLGAYRNTDNNAFCQFDGYTESGQPSGSLGVNSIGSGPQFAGTTGSGSYLRANGLDGGGLSSSNGFYAKRTKVDGTTVLKHVMGPDPVNNEYDLFTSPGGLTFGFANLSDDWGFQTGSLFEAFRVKNGFTSETFGRSATTGTRGKLQFQTGFFLGSGSGARNITQASGVPANSGDIAEGEVSFAQNPSTTKAMAAVCYTGSATTPTWYKAGAIFIDASATYDPPSIAASGTTTTTVTATGAALGDIAQASFSLALGGLMMTAEVSSANTVTVRLFNPTGSAVDLASGTLKVRVSKA